MEFVRVWVRQLLRRGWTATIVLALLCGITAGLAMTAIEAGRRSSVAFDDFLEYAAPPDTQLNVCPVEIQELSPEALRECGAYLPSEERARIATLPEVDSVVIVSFAGISVAPASAPDDVLSEAAMIAYQDGPPRNDGRQLVVRGRAAAPGAADEVVVNERLFRDLGISLGDEVIVTFPSEAEYELVPAERFHGAQVRASVVGVTRGLADLGDSSASSFNQFLSLLAGPGVAKDVDNPRGFSAMFVTSRDGDAAVAETAIREAIPDNLSNFAAAISDDELDPIRDAIRYESYGVILLGALAALAVAAFTGQAIARQTRNEWVDLPTLRALGVTTVQARQAAMLRTAVVALLALAVAVVTAIVLSPLGPAGVARRTVVDPGVAVDMTVLVVGALVLAVVLLGTAWLTIRSAARRRTDGERGWMVGWLPPTVTAGLAMSRPSRRNDVGSPLTTAVVGATLALILIVAAVGVRASLDGLHDEPARVGAPWDLAIVAGDGDPRSDNALDRLAELDVTAAAAGISGADVDIGGQVVWVHAFVPVDGVADLVPPPILSGRAPVADDEIALGKVTLADLDLALGDSVVLSSTTSDVPSRTLTIVGTAVVNDTYEPCAGCGGIVTPPFISSFAPEAAPDPVVVQLRDGVDESAVLAELSELYSGGVAGPEAPQAVRNIERIGSLPFVLAGLAALLAAASIVHAMVLSVRRHRSQLAVLRVIGFTRRQGYAAVATHAASLALAAAIVGVPLGLVVARHGWRILTDQVGAAFVPEVPVVVVVAVVLGAVAATVLIALAPGTMALRGAPGPALRVE